MRSRRKKVFIKMKFAHNESHNDFSISNIVIVCTWLYKSARTSMWLAFWVWDTVDILNWAWHCLEMRILIHLYLCVKLICIQKIEYIYIYGSITIFVVSIPLLHEFITRSNNGNTNNKQINHCDWSNRESVWMWWWWWFTSFAKRIVLRSTVIFW